MKAYAERRQRASAFASWLTSLERELLAGAERHGPIAGRIRPPQRCFSTALDVVAHERQELAAAVQLELFAVHHRRAAA